MGNTAAYVQSGFRPYGPAELQLWHDVKDEWQTLGKMESSSFDEDIEEDILECRIEGEDREIERRTRKRKARLSLSALEITNPDLMQIIHGDKGTTQTKTSMDLQWEQFQQPLYFDTGTGDAFEAFVPWRDSMANTETLRKLASISAAAPSGSSGSDWATAGNPDYYVFAVGLYRRSDSNVVPLFSTVNDTDKQDYDWVLGEVSSSTTVNFTGATQSVVITGTAPAGDNAQVEVLLPDYVAIYFNTTNTITGAVCGGVGTYAAYIGAGIECLTITGGDTYAASKFAKFRYNTGTEDSPSWTDLAVDTDIDWDETRGMFKWYSAAVGANGRHVQVRYFYVKATNVSTGLGRSRLGQDLRKLRIMSIEPEQFAGAPVYGAGYVLTLFKADMAGLRSKFQSGSGSWAAPTDLDVVCLADPTNSNEFGTVESVTQKLRSYTQQIA